ncbi:Protein of unknown function, partial [Gryllus bimaculatus]
TNASEWFTTASVPGTFAANIYDSSAVEHAVTASAVDAYASPGKDLFDPCEVLPQVFMDVSHDPCTSEQVQEAILGDESANSVC